MHCKWFELEQTTPVIFLSNAALNLQSKFNLYFFPDKKTTGLPSLFTWLFGLSACFMCDLLESTSSVCLVLSRVDDHIIVASKGRWGLSIHKSEVSTLNNLAENIKTKKKDTNKLRGKLQSDIRNFSLINYDAVENVVNF